VLAPAAIGNIGVDSAKALCNIGVQVIDDLKPHLAGGGQERIADRQIEPRLFYRDRPVVAVPLAGAAGIGLGLLEVRQHLIERPARTAKLRPLVEFERMAAQIQHAIDAARTAKDAPLKPR